jgi:hypothetical protein
MYEIRRRDLLTGAAATTTAILSGAGRAEAAPPETAHQPLSSPEVCRSSARWALRLARAGREDRSTYQAMALDGNGNRRDQPEAAYGLGLARKIIARNPATWACTSRTLWKPTKTAGPRSSAGFLGRCR